MIVTPRSEERRLLREAVETTRDVQSHGRRCVGQVHRVKRLLRNAGVPVPRPRSAAQNEETLRQVW